MAETDATGKTLKPGKEAEPETVGEAKELETAPGYWKLTDDEILLRSPKPEDD